MTAPVARILRRAGEWSGEDDRVTLGYEARFLRRKVLTTDRGECFLVDLAQAVSLARGDAFELADGRLIAVIAAEEPLLEITAADAADAAEAAGTLARLAWHIGNRHAPCQIARDRLLIAPDHVLREMVENLGGRLREVREPFTPEGGAYGHGRTHGHSH